MRRKFGFQVLRIPDTVVHSPAVAIDQPHFFGRIELGNGAHPGAHKKSQVFVRCTVHVRVEKRRVFRIVDSRKQVGVHVVDRIALQECLGQTFGHFVAVAEFIFPVLKSAGGLGWRSRFGSEHRGEQ